MEEMFYCFGHYIDPYSRGIILEKKYNNFDMTKRAMKEKFEVTQEVRTNAEPAEEILDMDDPMEMLISQRVAVPENTQVEQTAIEIEMQRYESLPKVSKDVDVVKWWVQRCPTNPVQSCSSRSWCSGV